MTTSRWRRVSAVVLTAALATTLSTAGAQADDAGRDSAADSASTPVLQAQPHNRLSQIERLESSERKHPITPHSVTDVLGDLNRSTRKPASCTPNGPRPHQHPDKGFCWNSGDTKTSKWMPQGLTNSKFGGKKVWMASWYSDAKPAQSRITLVDGKGTKYRHIVLADPGKDNDDGLAPVPTHAGGIAVVGDYLYVADSGKGVRVFDLNHIWKANGGKADGKYYMKDGEIHASGYGYVLPQVGSYTAKTKPTGPCKKAQNPYFSSVSADLGAQRLVSGEYCGESGSGRVVTWPLVSKGENKGLLKQSDSTVRSTKTYSSGLNHMQGIATVGKKAHATSSHGKSTRGVWHKLRIKGDTLSETKDYKVAAPGPEDVTVSGKRYWTLTEHPDKRYVFPNDAGVSLD